MHNENILEQMFQTSNEIKQTFYKADRELKEEGKLSEETQEVLQRLCRDHESVVTELGKWYLYTDSKLEGLKAEYKPIREAMDANQKALEDRCDFIKWCIKNILPQSDESQVVNKEIYVHYRKAERVEIFDPEIIPIEYVRTIQEPMAADIKKAIQNGAEVPGATVITNWSPQVKHGGENALKNAKKRLERLAKNEED
jgi:hypothetical protein